MNRTLLAVVVTFAALVMIGALAVASGLYNVGADEPHWSIVHGLLNVTRERSIAAHASDLEVPNLDDADAARRGAGNYDAMCAGCHLAPGTGESELSAGLYPAPPNLTRPVPLDSAEAFWVIKHGIKATGMAAWGKHMEDTYIWDLVAFLKILPSLSPEQYTAAVAASGGHSHGGGESSGHHHEQGEGHQEEPHVHEAPAGSPVRAVQLLHEAMSAGDAHRVQEILDPNVLILEGGSVERSRAEYAAHHLPADLEFMKGTVYKLERQTGDTVGDFAWVASEGRITGSRNDKPLDVISTESLVLRKSSGGWKVVHIHWSSRNAGKS